MNRLQTNDNFRSGIVALIGWTNVGKSTLLNRLTGMRLAIVSPKPQTTRQSILGIVNGPGYQIAFMDTPGIHNPQKRISNIMIDTSWQAAASSDVIIWTVVPDIDPKHQLEVVKSRLMRLGKPLIIAINKVDLIVKQELLPQIEFYDKNLSPRAVIPVSDLKGDNIDTLIEVTRGFLPDGPMLYSEETITDKPTRFLASEIIRLYVIQKTYQELPYSVFVDIEEYQEVEERNFVKISALIYVEKDSQKGILIGKGGEKLKQIGIAARLDLEDFLESKVDLRLWVKVSKNWRDDPTLLNRLGLLSK
jgi:GTPase